jgi:hypothetical protein
MRCTCEQAVREKLEELLAFCEAEVDETHWPRPMPANTIEDVIERLRAELKHLERRQLPHAVPVDLHEIGAPGRRS